MSLIGSKRITQDRVIKYAKVTGLVGVPLAMILFLLMINLDVITIKDYSGDMFCGGDIPCYANLTFCVRNDTFIYPMDGSWMLETDGSYGEIPIRMYRTWGDGLREIKLNETCKGTWCGGKYGVTENKYVYAFRKGKCYDIVFEAEKNLYDTVKWSFGPVDPVWFGKNWTIQNDTVFINDSKAYIATTPYNITGDVDIFIDIISKTYGGDLDLAIGVDKDNFKVSTGYVWKEWNETVEDSYTCDDYFNYTLSPKYFWCWKYYPENGTPEHYELIYNHSFDRGNISAKTAWWNVTEQHKEWMPLGDTFKVNREYEGMDTWYIKKDIDVDAGREYNLKIDITPPKRKSGKYFVCLKPSAETISEAIAADHFYCLDPWYYSIDSEVTYEIGYGYDTGWDNITDYNSSTNITVTASSLVLTGYVE